MFNKDNKKEISAIEDLLKAKIYVNPKRFEELNKLKGDIWSQNVNVAGDPCTLLCFNVSPEVEEQLHDLGLYRLQVERISEDPADPSHKEDRKRFLKVFGGKRLEKARVVAIVHELRGEDEELTLLDRRIIALSLLNKLPVVVLATQYSNALPAAKAATGDTWPVFFVPHPREHMGPVREVTWLSTELPRVRALSASIESDLHDRVAHLSRVNAPLHFLTRASVALVPFGVMTVNFLGILRLMANMLQCVGMRGDTSANKSLGLLGAKNAALVSAVDSLGDVYSFAVFTTVLADLQGLGLVEAAAAMDVLDGLMLGSISVVTGAVSALGAYLSRPLVVRAAAEFLASLQTIYVLNPSMRRERERRPRASKGTKKKEKVGKEGCKGEELREFLRRSGRNARLHGGTAAAQAAATLAVAAATDDEPQEEGRRAVGPEAAVLHGSDSDSSGSASGDGTDGEGDGSEEDEGTDGEVQEAVAAQASVRDGNRQAAISGAEADGSFPASSASADASLESGAGPSSGAFKPSRAEKKQLALVQKQAAREAKEARAVAKAAARAEKKAAKMAERARKRQAKQQQKEQKAEEKAAAKLAKGEGRPQLVCQARGHPRPLGGGGVRRSQQQRMQRSGGAVYQVPLRMLAQWL
ncbi:hypothetical protein VOLCADRAFT_94709 [Volvox carteri f. nagariensis]|uniref:Uncharacterized protein n=1 Tax=Volvox carteri f. nagariensis TaxID=3068 RepID=D8U5I8_VOLCA|nr:uncharacterized protein VOLCADRAFT_94709 [Volvox carteri f. nagariensis]EFJ44928.1 hypothetical protein VOLCADRAFT_94709 [Volvox carteri f. nagariensis]|eukprot:XP_002953899.1 hypothetical protein VOLCADRAFT_94709 [Volvox carteri f. nagariensis]